MLRSGGLPRRIERLFGGQYDRAGFGIPLLKWEGADNSEYAYVRKLAEEAARRPIRWRDPEAAAAYLGRSMAPMRVRGCGHEITTDRVIAYSAKLIVPAEVAVAQEHGLDHSLLFEYPESSSEADVWLLMGERVAPAMLVRRWRLRTLLDRVPWMAPWFLERWLDLVKFKTGGQKFFVFG